MRAATSNAQGGVESEGPPGLLGFAALRLLAFGEESDIAPVTGEEDVPKIGAGPICFIAEHLAATLLSENGIPSADT